MKQLQFGAGVLAILIFAPATALELDTAERRLGYLMGLKYGQQLKEKYLRVDPEALALGVKDVLNAQPPRLTPAEKRQVFSEGRKAAKQLKNETETANLQQSTSFLQENRDQDGVTQLPSGVQYRILTPAEGPAPGPNAEVTLHVRGTLIDGWVFQDTHKAGKPVDLAVEKLAPGLRDVIMKMAPGAKWRAFIPPEQAYGTKGSGRTIGPNELLIMEIELLAADTPLAEE